MAQLEKWLLFGLIHIIIVQCGLKCLRSNQLAALVFMVEHLCALPIRNIQFKNVKWTAQWLGTQGGGRKTEMNGKRPLDISRVCWVLRGWMRRKKANGNEWTFHTIAIIKWICTFIFCELDVQYSMLNAQCSMFEKCMKLFFTSFDFMIEFIFQHFVSIAFGVV